MSTRYRTTFWLAAIALAAMPLRLGAEPTSAPAPETRPVRSADKADIESQRVGRGEGGALDGWVRTIGAMAVVVVLILLARWGLRKLGPAAAGGRGGKGLDVLASVSLSPRHQLRLVRLGRRVVLVGVGPEGLAALSEVTDPAEVADLLAEVDARGSESKKRPDRPKTPTDQEGQA
jgi:flagellar biogenesis protein FliO